GAASACGPRPWTPATQDLAMPLLLDSGSDHGSRGTPPSIIGSAHQVNAWAHRNLPWLPAKAQPKAAALRDAPREPEGGRVGLTSVVMPRGLGGGWPEERCPGGSRALLPSGWARAPYL